MNRMLFTTNHPVDRPAVTAAMLGLVRLAACCLLSGLLWVLPVSALDTNAAASTAEKLESQRNSERKTERKAERKAASAERTPPESSTTNSAGTTTGTDLAAFRIISDRNIFNSDRTRRSSRSDGEKPKVAQVDTLSFVGFLGSPKGSLAFFDGSSASSRKAVKAGESIAGFKVSTITPTSVVLESGDKKFDLSVGGQLRREDEGPWVSSGSRTLTASTSVSDSTSESSGDAGADDALQRLLKKREQELAK